MRELRLGRFLGYMDFVTNVIIYMYCYKKYNINDLNTVKELNWLVVGGGPPLYFPIVYIDPVSEFFLFFLFLIFLFCFCVMYMFIVYAVVYDMVYDIFYFLQCKILV